MPVPSDITALSTTAASNSPAGSETPSSIDDYLRSHASFIAQLRAVIGGATNPNIPTATGTAAAANLTTSALDTTAGRVLKVGDFGVGTPIATTNLNTLTGTGLFSCGGGYVTGAPGVSFLGWWVHQIDAGAGFWKDQTAWQQGNPAIQYVRSAPDGTTWGPWIQAIFADSPVFTGTPSGPTAAPGTNTTQFATTEFVLANQSGLGIGQTWQNVLGSRALGTTYTNSSGNPIEVSVSTVASSDTNSLEVTVGGVSILNDRSASGTSGHATFIVPAGATYSVASDKTLNRWAELRA